MAVKRCMDTIPLTPTPKATIEHDMDEKGTEKKFKTKILWLNVLGFLVLHALALYGYYYTIVEKRLRLLILGVTIGYTGAIGITAGCHRLWSHRSYKAKWPLRVLLGMLCCIAGQNDIYDWCRNHRVHHKFVETDADPHNIHRGLFFAHIGWLMCKKHPDVSTKGKTVPFDDLLADPIVRYQRKFYYPLFLVFSFVLPTYFGAWLCAESLWVSFLICGMARYITSLHITWCVNSIAHWRGGRPFDKRMESRENTLVALLSNGEGWHNYHHVFPWDYAASELGYNRNLTKIFIDFMALIGQAYDLKTAHPDSVYKAKLKTGDGTRLKF